MMSGIAEMVVTFKSDNSEGVLHYELLKAKIGDDGHLYIYIPDNIAKKLSFEIDTDGMLQSICKSGRANLRINAKGRLEVET